MTNNNRRKSGFTLIELLVVVSIIGLLSSVVLASLNSAREKARDAQRITEVRQIQLALELYRDANDAYPLGATFFESSNAAEWSGLATNLAPYIATLPVDPINNAATFGDFAPGGPNYPAYTYMYFSPFGAEYNIMALLEDANNTASCNLSPTFAGSTVVWCDGAGGGLIADHAYILSN